MSSSKAARSRRTRAVSAAPAGTAPPTATSLLAAVLDSTPAGSAPRSGVVVGTLAALHPDGTPLLELPGQNAGVSARSTVPLDETMAGRQVVVVFEGGDPQRPIVIGVVGRNLGGAPLRDVQVDGERLVFEAEREIVLRCGPASITLTRSGKVIIRGAYVSSRSSGVNRIKGGSVQIN